MLGKVTLRKDSREQKTIQLKRFKKFVKLMSVGYEPKVLTRLLTDTNMIFCIFS